jgi:hypothetical protein
VPPNTSYLNASSKNRGVISQHHLDVENEWESWLKWARSVTEDCVRKHRHN